MSRTNLAVSYAKSLGSDTLTGNTTGSAVAFQSLPFQKARLLLRLGSFSASQVFYISILATIGGVQYEAIGSKVYLDSSLANSNLDIPIDIPPADAYAYKVSGYTGGGSVVLTDVSLQLVLSSEMS